MHATVQLDADVAPASAGKAPAASTDEAADLAEADQLVRRIIDANQQARAKRVR